MVDLLGFGIVIPILPLYAKGLAQHPTAWMTRVNGLLGLTDSPFVFWAGVVLVIHPIAQFIAAPILGRISDLVGRRPVLWTSLMGTCAAYLLMAVTGRFELVLLARVLDGITGGNISVAQAAMADSSSPQERSKALGIIGAAFGLGFVLGPALAGILAGSHLGKAMLQNYGWQLPFFVAAGMSFVASMLVLFFLPETLRPEAKVHARKVQSRGHALIRELRRPGMAQILAITFLAMTGFAMMEGTYALLCARRFNFSQRGVGYLFAFVGVLIVIYQGGLVRMVAKRIKERVALLVGLAMMTLALPLIPYAPWEAPFLLVMVPLCWGSGMNQTATSALASQITPPDEQGGLFGVITSMSTVGRIVGPLLGTFIFAKFGYAAPYWLAAAFLALGLLLAVTLLRPAPPQPEEDPI
jgi:MFS family permease